MYFSIILIEFRASSCFCYTHSTHSNATQTCSNDGRIDSRTQWTSAHNFIWLFSITLPKCISETSTGSRCSTASHRLANNCTTCIAGQPLSVHGDAAAATLIGLCLVFALLQLQIIILDMTGARARIREQQSNECEFTLNCHW